MTELNIPEIEEEITADDDFPNSPEFQEAVRRAQSGQYEHTLFEMWDEVLDKAIAQATPDRVTIPLADGLMRQWPWLDFKHLPGYLKERKALLEEAQEVLRGCFPKPAELLFLENEDDWTRHKDAYMAVIVEWTKLCNVWSDRWEQTALTHHSKGYLMAATADATSLVLNPTHGLIENMRNLAGFEITDEEGAQIQALIHGTVDE